MRGQWCRDNIDKAAEMCGLGEDVVAEVKRANEFCALHPDMSVCSTRAIMALLRVKDDKERESAISLAENALNVSTPTGGKKRDRLTEPEIKKLIKKAEMVVRGKLTQKNECEKETQPVNVAPQPADLQSDESMPEPQSLSQEIVGQEPTLAKCALGTESDHDRRLRLAQLLNRKQEAPWKPRHIARTELISELTDQYLSKMQWTARIDLIESGQVEDEIDAILWIVDRYQEMQAGAT